MMLDIWHYWQIWDWEVVERVWQEMTQQFNLGCRRKSEWKKKNFDRRSTLCCQPRKPQIWACSLRSGPCENKSAWQWAVERDWGRRGRERWRFNLGERSTRSQSQRTLTEDDLSASPGRPLPTHVHTTCRGVHRHQLTPMCVRPRRKSQRRAGKFTHTLRKGQRSCHTRHHLTHRKEQHLYSWQTQPSHFLPFSCNCLSEEEIIKDLQNWWFGLTIRCKK